MVFSNARAYYSRPAANNNLYVHSYGSYKKDDFRHELNLAIEEDETFYLIAGCAHTGILNILDQYRELKGQYPQVVIAGFHLQSRECCNTNKNTHEIEKCFKPVQRITHAIAPRLMHTRNFALLWEIEYTICVRGVKSSLDKGVNLIVFIGV